MPDMKLKYVSTEENFIRAGVLKNDTIKGTVYIEKKWIEFEK
jgi:hypothetical protein